MRKLLSVLSSTLQGGVRGGLLFLALLATTNLWAYDFQFGDLYYNITSSYEPYTVEVTYQRFSSNYSGFTSVTIPETVTYDGTTYSVTSIGDEAFWDCRSLTSVTIPNSVESIGYEAFRYCSSLTSITIPNSVTSIGDYAFDGCIFTKDNFVNNSSLDAEKHNYWYASIGDTEIDGLLIRNDTVIDCRPNVTSAIIPNSVTSIGDYAFDGCSSLTSITIPESVTSIGSFAFEDCSSLTSITIPKSVTNIRTGVFSACDSLASIIIESGNTIYDSRENCNAIIKTETNTLINGCQNTIIPNSVTSIGDYAFYGCFSLTSITIPNSVTSIGYVAFYGCSSLTSVTIPNSVTSIGDYAFYGCSSLTSVTIPNSVTSIGREAFDGTGIYENESNWENDVLYIDNCLIEAKTSISGAYTIKENTRLIACDAFDNCSSLTSVTIPNSVTSIGFSAFSGCSSLTSVTIGNSVTTIGDFAFSDCSSLTSITIPNSVTSIGWCAFEDCSSLTSVSIPNSVTSIGSYAFENCSSLTSITIGNSVTNIERHAFYGCFSLKHVEWNVKNHTDFNYWNNRFFDNQSPIQSFTFGENVEYIPAYLCYNMDSLKTITIPNSVTSIGSSAFGECSSLKHVEWNVKNHTDFDYYNRPFDDQPSIQSFTFGEDVEYIPAYLCYDMDSLTSITIPNSVTSIGSRAFEDCSSLTSVTIGNSVTSIGSRAFEDCSSLTSVTIGNSVTSIGSSAFDGCSSLASVTIPNSVTSIGGSAFYGCSSLKHVEWNVKNHTDFDYYNRPFDTQSPIQSFTFGEDVEYIPAYLCYDMDSLKTITIPNSVDSIGGQAFYSCDSLVSVTIGNSVTSIGDEAFIYCDSLRFIFSAPLLPPAIESNVFSFNAYDNATLHVLSSDYKTHNVWKQFDSIQVADTIYSDGIRYKVINKSGKLLSESLLTEDSFNQFTRVSVAGTQTWRYDSQYGAKMSGFQDNVTHTNEDWFISPALDLEGCSSATLTFSHAFGPKSSIPTTDSQKAQYTIWVSNDFEGDVNAATWTELKGMIYGDTGWGFVSSGDITIPTENLKGNCRVAWKYVCENSSATWEIKNVSLSATTDTNTKPTLQVINGESPYSGDIAIPSIVKYMNADLEVASIGNIAFRNCSSLNSVTIENGITTIEEYAFYNSSLTSIYLPNTLTNIGYSAFRGCSSLISIAIPNGVTTIRNNTFSGCSFLTSATISNGVMAIDKYAFADCSSLNTISVPNSVTRIGQSTFKNCTSLVEVTLSNEMNTLEKETFQDCSSLKFVRLGGKLTTIGESVFSACTALNEITLPASVKSIGENAFAGCTKLYDIYCFAMEPPTAYESSFANYNAFLHVPCDNQRVYLLDILFGNFKYVECIEAETAPTDTVVVTPSFNDAEFIWPSNSSADSYTLAISKDGEIFCTLTFNANGQLTGIAFAPSRNGQHNAPAAAQTANGFAFTVTGLDEGANYTYDLLIQDRSGNTLQSYSGEFRTQSTNDRTVTVEYDAAQGQVTGAGTYLVGDTVTLTATPNEGYRFVRWSNEVEDNPYTFVISDNVTLSAEFEEVITTSVENTSPSQQSDTHKLLRDGQLLILRDGKTYNIMGAEIK